MTTKREMQDVLDDMRNNEQLLEEFQDLIEKHSNIQASLSKEHDSLNLDLLEDGKIKWADSNLNDWSEYIGDDKDTHYYIYYYDGSSRQEGYFKGIPELEESELIHFKKYLNDYFYYGHPNYVDRNHPNSEMTECELAFECGDARYQTISYS